ncbi:hypothetical protein ACFQRB_20435 [Halobaculum litoreum]|uniref:Uncharacterized protein n=1 Tax=Halobaculum litoreum TaxID=3031998 RepID=A0ABD5XYC0_9EURY
MIRRQYTGPSFVYHVKLHDGTVLGVSTTTPRSSRWARPSR